MSEANDNGALPLLRFPFCFRTTLVLLLRYTPHPLSRTTAKGSKYQSLAAGPMSSCVSVIHGIRTYCASHQRLFARSVVGTHMISLTVCIVKPVLVYVLNERPPFRCSQERYIELGGNTLLSGHPHATKSNAPGCACRFDRNLRFPTPSPPPSIISHFIASSILVVKMPRML